MDTILDWLYSDVMLDASVFDEIYEAVKEASPGPKRDEFIEWYTVNLGDNSDD